MVMQSTDIASHLSEVLTVEGQRINNEARTLRKKNFTSS